uniref:Integrase catalytic domain-containing protein n=1 Tax=Amphiprion percula TaxID=161767 RepID=A0A3P8RTR8_AMPPE
MDNLVHSVLSSCTVCQSCDKTVKTSPAPLQPVDFPECPFQHVAVDIVGPFERGPLDCRFAITLVDYFSKWPEVAFTPNATTATVITFLSSVFAHEGNPCAITSDNGPQFTSCDFADFLRERGIKHIRTSVYHPQANGSVERFNRVLKDCIQGAQAAQKQWKPTVTAMLQNYRATPHATTNESPFQLLRGRPMRTKLHILPQHDHTGCYNKVRVRIALQQAKSKSYTDKKRGAKPPKLAVGDKVHIRKPFYVGKGERQYTDPVSIQQQTGYSTFILSDGKRWNATRLSLCPERAEEPSCQASTAGQNASLPETFPNRTNPQRMHKPPGWTKDYVMK